MLNVYISRDDIINNKYIISFYEFTVLHTFHGWKADVDSVLPFPLFLGEDLIQPLLEVVVCSWLAVRHCRRLTAAAKERVDPWVTCIKLNTGYNNELYREKSDRLTGPAMASTAPPSNPG